MAFTEFHCQTTGSNLNAGSTTADAASLTYASGTWVAATGVFTVASGNPLSDGVAVGDFVSVYIDGATVGVFVGRVTARNATTITVSLTAKSGTAPVNGTSTRTLKVGGAWKGPNAAEGFPIGFVQNTMTNAAGEFPRVNMKGGTNYAITAAMTHANAGPTKFECYTTTVGDGGKATIDGGTSGASYVLLTISGANIDLEDLILQNNGATGSASGLALSAAECMARRCVVNSVRGIGINLNAGDVYAIECEVYAANQSNTAITGGFVLANNECKPIRCISHDNAGSNTSGFVIISRGTLIDCIADTNGRNGYLYTSTQGITLIGCEAYNNVLDGVNLANSAAALVYMENCNLVKNGGWGINGSTAFTRNGCIVNCGFGSGTQANTSGTITGLSAMVESGSVNYAADVTPWVDPANGDFRINLAAAKGAGRGTFTETAASYAGTVGYPDRGAAQHLEVVGAAYLVNGGLVE